MKMNHLWICALLPVLTVNLMSCGKKKDKDSDQGGDPNTTALTGPAAFVGDWTGSYRARNSDGKPEGDFHPVEVQFKDGPQSTFSITLKDQADAIVKGTWDEFAGKNLQLTITSSSISRIASIAPGKTSVYIEPEYELMGSSAAIHNENFELKIQRLKTQVPSGGGGTTISGPIGLWSCSGGGRNTQLNIDDRLNWRASIQSDGHSMMLLSGTGSSDSSGYTLLVKSSQPQVRSDSALRFELDTNSARLAAIILDRPNDKDSLGECRH